MRHTGFWGQRGRFHVALALSLVVGAFLMLVDRRANLFGLLPFVLVVASIAAYVLLHRQAHLRGPAPRPRR
jgi:hypothetical protein